MDLDWGIYKCQLKKSFLIQWVFIRDRPTVQLSIRLPVRNLQHCSRDITGTQPAIESLCRRHGRTHVKTALIVIMGRATDGRNNVWTQGRTRSIASDIFRTEW